MNKPIETIGVIKESRPDENRTPLAPEHIEKLKTKYPNLNILVQPSKNRCFSDSEYKSKGAEINEDLTNCSIIFGVKEIDTKVVAMSILSSLQGINWFCLFDDSDVDAKMYLDTSIGLLINSLKRNDNE